MFETHEPLEKPLKTLLLYRWAMLERQRYFTPAEVAAHNTAADLWVSFLGRVCDLTPLMNQFKGQGVLCVLTVARTVHADRPLLKPCDTSPVGGQVTSSSCQSWSLQEKTSAAGSTLRLRM